MNCVTAVTNKHVDLIAINETRLDLNVSDNMVDLRGYNIVRKDRSRHGGGVCIYLRNTINYTVRHDIVPAELESVCVEIIKPHSRSFLVTTIYRPPNSTESWFDSFEKLIKFN